MSETDYEALEASSEVRTPSTPLEEAQRALGVAGARHDLVMELFRLSTLWLDEPELLRELLTVLENLMGAEASSVIMMDRHEGDLYFATATGPIGEDILRCRLDQHEGIVGWCMDSGRTVRINNVEAESHWHREISDTFGFGVRQVLAVPVRVGNRVIGCIELINKRGADSAGFTVDDEVLMRDAGECLSLLFSLRSKGRER